MDYETLHHLTSRDFMDRSSFKALRHSRPFSQAAMQALHVTTLGRTCSESLDDFWGICLGVVFLLKKNLTRNTRASIYSTNKLQGLGFSFKKGLSWRSFPRKNRLSWKASIDFAWLKTFKIRRYATMLHWIKLASYHLSPSTAITSNRKMRLKSPNHSAATRLLDKMHFFQQQKHHTPIPCFFTGGNGSTVGHSVPLHKFRNFKTQQFFHISAYIFMASSICSAKCGSQIVGTLCASLLAFELPLNKWSASCQFAPQALIAVLKVTMLFGTWCNSWHFLPLLREMSFSRVSL